MPADFSDPDVVESYASRVMRHVPGLNDLHRMAGILLGENQRHDAEILVLGAGGGMELKAFAAMHGDWRFHGVDPSAEMLDLARATIGPRYMERVELLEGYIEDAPDGPFDGAACLLTLHFLEPALRLETLKRMRQRLKNGAPIVVAHHSFEKEDGKHDLWLRRNADLLITGGLDAAKAGQTVEAIKNQLPALSQGEDEALLSEAGFADIELFYAAFTFKGWVARAA
ncbi:class I SAM-dependent methyltransferase [Nitratireductor basaltis]|uniref:Methylase involved in ubiquinone/menaquinone biosynthesis n=1 Tax=Nitratireductor basaltis TaxID=472175 RepID=A0A084UBC3_9HYPH|nr:class I SAM-dependent methyltransferase [Nitratireductor basaltis]KFB10259.1 Methylase involved in ubiquinone/menaquinone biosynthesis [Nitratireductor basaltis]